MVANFWAEQETLRSAVRGLRKEQTDEGLKQIREILRTARERSQPNDLRGFAQTLNDYWNFDEFDRSKLVRLENVGKPPQGAKKLKEIYLRYLAPFTWYAEKNRPYTEFELIAIVRGEKVSAIASLPVSGLAHSQSVDSLITDRSNSDLLRGNINKSGSVMTHSSSEKHHGLKLFAATLKVARMQVQGEIVGVPVSSPATLEEVCAIMADLTPVETITPEILNLAETGHLDALPGDLIPGVAALQYVTDENDRPYTSAELSRIVLGELIPINKQTGQPFTPADLSELGVHQNNCSSLA